MCIVCTNVKKFVGLQELCFIIFATTRDCCDVTMQFLPPLIERQNAAEVLGVDLKAIPLIPGMPC